MLNVKFVNFGIIRAVYQKFHYIVQEMLQQMIMTQLLMVNYSMLNQFMCVLHCFCCCTELISSSANHSPNFNRSTSHKTSSSLLSRRKARIPSINSIPVSVRKIDMYIYISNKLRQLYIKNNKDINLLMFKYIFFDSDFVFSLKVAELNLVLLHLVQIVQHLQVLL